MLLTGNLYPNWNGKMKKDKQHEQFLKELKQFGKEMLSDPELAKEQLLKAGINTKTGRLTKHYREGK